MEQLQALLANLTAKSENNMPQVTLEDITTGINNGKYKRIVCMVGAGLSTAAGIPDFRSPKTGLYANLQKYNLPRPEAVFDLQYFMKDQRPFYVVCRDILPHGQFYPTLAHCFITLLDKKGLLQRCFTQNIDGLELSAGLPDEKLVFAHGSMATATCLKTGKKVDMKIVRDAMRLGEVPKSPHHEEGIVKPDVVFFGEQLPKRFFDKTKEDLPACDLLIVLGTSLVVYPFAALVTQVEDDVPRVLINREAVGPFETPEKRDVNVLGDLDEQVEGIAKALGWLDELKELHAATKAKLEAEYVAEGATPAAAAAAAASSATSSSQSAAKSPAPAHEQEAPVVIDDVTALKMAMESGDTNMVRALLEGGVDGNIRVPGHAKVVEITSSGKSSKIGSVSLLDVAIMRGDFRMVEVLLKGGVKADNVDEGGSTPLMLAAQEGLFDIVQLLLECHADPNLADIGGGTALIRACDRGHENVAAELIRKGANVNAKGIWVGGTPLIWAVPSGNVELIKILLDAGADAAIKNNSEQTALDIAETLGYEDVAALIKEHNTKSAGAAAAPPTKST